MIVCIAKENNKCFLLVPFGNLSYIIGLYARSVFNDPSCLLSLKKSIFITQLVNDFVTVPKEVEPITERHLPQFISFIPLFHRD